MKKKEYDKKYPKVNHEGIALKYVYALVKDNKMFYVGVSSEPHVRFRGHKSRMKIDGMDWVVLEQVLASVAYKAEQKWIEALTLNGVKLLNRATTKTFKEGYEKYLANRYN